MKRDFISRVTDAVLDDVRLWQNRPLDECYLVVWIDALVVKIREALRYAAEAVRERELPLRTSL